MKTENTNASANDQVQSEFPCVKHPKYAFDTNRELRVFESHTPATTTQTAEDEDGVGSSSRLNDRHQPASGSLIVRCLALGQDGGEDNEAFDSERNRLAAAIAEKGSSIRLTKSEIQTLKSSNSPENAETIETLQKQVASEVHELLELKSAFEAVTGIPYDPPAQPKKKKMRKKKKSNNNHK